MEEILFWKSARPLLRESAKFKLIERTLMSSEHFPIKRFKRFLCQFNHILDNDLTSDIVSWTQPSRHMAPKQRSIDVNVTSWRDIDVGTTLF